MCLGELRDVFELSQDLRLGAIPRHSIHGRHHRLLDHLGLDAEAEKKHKPCFSESTAQRTAHRYCGTDTVGGLISPADW